MATFSRSHQFASGVAPLFAPAVTPHVVHGRVECHIWSDDGAAFTLRITRPAGVAVDFLIPAFPANHWRTPLHPDEVFTIQTSSVAGSAINVVVT